MTKLNCLSSNPNRREFVKIASGLVLGGVVGCDRWSSTTNNVANFEHPLYLPNRSINTRVRIGRFRGEEPCFISGEQISINRNKWVLPKGMTKFFEAKVGDQLISTQKTYDVGKGKTQKKITGRLCLHPRLDINSVAFDLVAHIPIEEYLPGVLAGELYAHWHPDTFAAQAVAARSYAVVQHLSWLKKSHFDLNDTAASQMFLGDVTLDVAHRAVQETKGIVLSWKNTVVPAYYSACCGGNAATANHGIGDSEYHNIPPLLGRSGQDVCANIGVSRWIARRPSRVFRERINSCAKMINNLPLSNLRSIRAIKPAAFNKHGRPIGLTITDWKEKCFEIAAKDLLRISNMNIDHLPPPLPTIWSSSVSCVKSEDELVFSGTGLGHGVGLCQYGSQQLAGDGFSWDSILGWYYPKAELKTLWV